MSKLRRLLCGVLGLLAVSGSANGALLDYDGFDYTGAAIADKNGGIGWDGAWVNTTGDPRLTDDGVSLDSSAFPFTSVGSRLWRDPPDAGGGLDRAATRNLSESFSLGVDGNVLYASTLVRRGSDGTATSASDMQFQFQTSGGTIGFRFGVSAADVFFVGLNAVDTNSGAAPIAADTVYFLVAKVVSSSAGTDQLFLKVYGPDDVVPQTEPGTWDLSTSGTRSDVVTRLRVNMGSNNSYAEVDEIRIGTDWESVAVPEPASLILFGLAGLVATRRQQAK